MLSRAASQESPRTKGVLQSPAGGSANAVRPWDGGGACAPAPSAKALTAGIYQVVLGDVVALWCVPSDESSTMVDRENEASVRTKPHEAIESKIQGLDGRQRGGEEAAEPAAMDTS